MKKVFKWIAVVLGSLVGLILTAALALFLMGSARLNKTYDFPPSNHPCRSCRNIQSSQI